MQLNILLKKNHNTTVTNLKKTAVNIIDKRWIDHYEVIQSKLEQSVLLTLEKIKIA